MRFFSFVISSLILALWMAGGANAASFDCKKAVTPLEKAICDFPALSELDEVLADAYNSTRLALTEDGSDAVLASQREWIQYSERACTPDAEPRRTAYTEDDAYCLEDVLRRRIEDLGFDHEVGPYSIYAVHRYRAVKDNELDDWHTAGQKSLSYPVFSGDGDEAAAINAAILKIVDSEIPGFDGEYDVDGYTDDDLSVTIEAVGPRRISFSETVYSYGHGAAHGNYAISYVHFLLQKRRPLREIDVFADANWPDVAMPAVLASLKADLGEDSLWVDDLAGIEASLVDTSRWILSPEGIGFQFQPYEVAAYAAGAPVATVPWDVLDNVLAKGARTIAGAR